MTEWDETQKTDPEDHDERACRSARDNPTPHLPIVGIPSARLKTNRQIVTKGSTSADAEWSSHRGWAKPGPFRDRASETAGCQGATMSVSLSSHSALCPFASFEEFPVPTLTT